MDSDNWTTRLAAAKRQLNLQHHRLSHGSSNHHYHNNPYHPSSSSGSHLSPQFDRLNVDDFEVEEETRTGYPCPYCYDDFDIASLCSHLEDEHSYETRVTFCPICSLKVARDMLSHITLQHGTLFRYQRRRRLRRVSVPGTQALSLLGRDLREAHLQALLGGSGYRSNNANISSAATDPLLSSLILNFPTSEVEEFPKSVESSVEDTCHKSTVSQTRFDPSLSYEERQRRIKQASVRAVFVQDLFASTLLAD